MKKPATAEHQLDELVDTAVQNFWSRILPPEGAEKPWLWYPGQKAFTGASYKDIYAQANCIAAYLMRKGVKKGDAVAILSDQSPFYLAIDLGLQFLGAVNLTLPLNITSETLGELIEKPGIRFIFIQKESVFLALDQLRDLKPGLKEVILLAEEVEDLDPEGIVTFDTIVNHGKIAWREFADQLRVMKASVVPTDTYALQYKNSNRKMTQVAFSDLLRDLDEALAYFSSAKFSKIVSMQSPDSMVERSFGLYAPLLLGIQTWCLPQGTTELPKRIKQIAPECAVTSPESLQRLEKEIIINYFSKDAAPKKRLVNAMRVCETRLKYIAEGKKPPIFIRLQHMLLRKTLFKTIQKLLGFKLKEIVCDAGPLDQHTFAFFRNTGYSVLRPRQEHK